MEARRFVEDEQVTAAQLTGIGAFRRATLAYFDWDEAARRLGARGRPDGKPGPPSEAG